MRVKQTNKTDAICATKILKHIQSVRDAFAIFKIKSSADFLSSHICQLAVAQAMTNVFELRKKLREEVVDNMPHFGRLRLKATRNIASHDYDSLDFAILFKQTQQLLDSEVNKELEALRDDKLSDSSD